MPFSLRGRIEGMIANVNQFQLAGSGILQPEDISKNVEQLTRKVLQSIEDLHRGFLYQLQSVHKDRVFPAIFALSADELIAGGKEDTEPLWYLFLLHS
jgi:hypothetical protein